MNKNKTSFWNLIGKDPIEIPIIQRDYAQGRIGQEYLRKNFLTSIKQALDSGKVLKLDFVYGPVEHGRLQPLDGQQRLTTLWLLHWYIALRAGKLEEACEKLKNFTYETRISSREFCENLCQASNFYCYKDGENIVSFIKSRTWFYSSWKQDPTIQALLNMLGGTKLAGKQEEDMVDGIEKLFKETDRETFVGYWNNLISKNASIIFYYLPLEKFGLSDDLYIKMNARGKQLTAFENFKADLIGYIQKQAEEKNEWKDLLNPQNGIPIKMDIKWTDVFWQHNVDKSGKVDEKFFAFLNRYFLNFAIVANAKEDSGAWKLYGLKSDDSTLLYDNGFNAYADILTTPQSLFNLSVLFENLIPNESINEYLPQWFNKFDFIPTYKTGDDGGFIKVDNNNREHIYKISTLTQPQRVVFFGICQYFERCSVFNELRFKRWMRVVCNLAENNTINTVEAMIGRIKLINELSKHAGNIYEFLANEDNVIKSKASQEQLSEEREKAKQILSACDDARLPDKPKNWDNSNEWNWESAILEAESSVFFKGAIRFLFMDGDNKIDWVNFAQKWENSLLIFTDDGLTEEYKKAAIANRIILSYCQNWWEQIQSRTHHDKYIFGFSSEIWHDYILLKTTGNALLYANPIHHLLMGDGINKSLKLEDTDTYRQTAFNKLVNTNIVEWAKKKKNTDWNYVRWTYDGLSLYPSSEGVILTMCNRDKILNRLIDKGTVTLIVGSQIDTIPNKMLYGWDIKFQYMKDNTPYQFAWQHWNWIDMYEGNNRLCDNNDTQLCSCNLTIDGGKIEDPEDFIVKMEQCIERYLDFRKHNGKND